MPGPAERDSLRRDDGHNRADALGLALTQRVRRQSTLIAAGGIIRRNLATLTVMGTLFVAMPNAVGDWADSRNLLAGLQLDQAGTQFLTNVVATVGQALLLAGGTHTVLVDAAGRRATLAESLGVAFRRLPPLLGLSVVTGTGIVLGTLLLVAPGILLMLRWFVAIPVRVAEGPGLSRALARSADLMHGRYWRCLGLVAVYAVAVGAAGVLVALIDTPVGGKTTTVAAIALESIVLESIGIGSAVTVAVVYLRLREGGRAVSC